MPIPTTSPLATASRFTGSSVLSIRFGSPQVFPVAAASTNNQRGVMTATPNDRLLGLIRCTRPGKATSQESCSIILFLSILRGETCPRAGREEQSDGTSFTTDHQQAAARAGPHREAQR